MNTPELETERLILRRFAPEDMEALYLLLRDTEVNTFLPWFPVKTLAETERFFAEKFEVKYQQPCGYHYAVCQKQDDKPIGYVNVSMDDSYDFGYALRKEFWGKGIMTEAGRAVIDRIKQDGIPYITATHDVNNPKSGSVMSRLGMQYQYSYEEWWQPKEMQVKFRMYQLNLKDKNADVYQKYWKNSDVHFIETDR